MSTRSRARSGALVVAAAVVVLLAPRFASAQLARGLLPLLQPGGTQPGDVFPDAFRSAFDDRRGWWSLARPTDGLELRLVREHFEPVTNRVTGGEGTAFDRALYADVGYSLGENARRWSGALRYDHPAWTTSIDGTDGGTRLRGECTMVSGSLRVADALPGLTIQGSAPLWRNGPALPCAAAGVGIRFAGSSRWAVQMSRTVTASDQEFLGHILEEPVPFALNLAAGTLRAAGRVTPWRRVAVEVAWDRYDFEPRSPVDLREVYELAPTGHCEGWSNAITADAGRGHDLGLRFTDEDLDVAADGLWGGQQYARLNYGRGYLRSWLLGWRWRTGPTLALQSEVEISSLKGEGRGKIESWPFTSTVIDLLGSKKVFEGNAVVDWTRLSMWATVDFALGRWRLGGSWFELHPDAALESWRPTFLVFGRSDFRRDELAVSRIRLASALVEASVPFGRHEFLMSLQQFFWVDVDEDRRTTDPPGDGGGGGADRVGGWLGGTYLVVGINLRTG